VVYATRYSIKGLKAAWRSEPAFRQEAIVLLISLPMSMLIGQSIYQIALLIGSVIFVIIIELLNSAVEAVVDRIGPEHHQLSGQAKDLGSAAVFLAIFLALVIWGLSFYQRFF